jgi:hypothetical protein
MHEPRPPSWWSPKTETVKYYDVSLGTPTRGRLCCRGPAATVNYNPILSSDRMLRSNELTTVLKMISIEKGKICHGSRKIA